MAIVKRADIPLPELEFDIAAMTYFVEYLMTDRPCIEALAQKGLPVDLKALELELVANSYLVSRTLPKNPQDGVVRLSRALELLLSKQRPSEANVASLVADFAAELGELYPFSDGNREPVSTASKFLWMHFRSPIVIYDALAVTWTGITHKSKDRDYAKYLTFWRKSYADRLEKIKKACSRLRHSPVAQSASKIHRIDLSQLSKERWFLERVFDHAIIHSASQHEAEFVRAQRRASLQ